MTDTQHDPVKDASLKTKVEAAPDRDDHDELAVPSEKVMLATTHADIGISNRPPEDISVTAAQPTNDPKGSVERKPISVAKLGKMKKRDPTAVAAKNHVRKTEERSSSPVHAVRHDPPPDRTSSPVEQKREREETLEDQPVKRQKRPGARRDPEEAERERLETIRRQEESDRKAREAAAIRNQYYQGSEVVRSHYNYKRNQGREERDLSPIKKLRNFNNWIKSTLIKMFTPDSRDARVRVLDMGCGKGGDLQKWDKADISTYVGIDLAEHSIEDARSRYRKMNRPRFRADFHAYDCFGLPLNRLLPPDQRNFDVVSMQFCLHYAFESEAKARQMLSNVACSLSRGGKFIGTIPSSDSIISHIEKLPAGKKDWGNEIYRVEFENDPPPGPNIVFRPPYGHKYTFYLKDAVDIVPEYVVPFNAFRALAEEYNLELLYHKGFHEVFDENCDGFEAGILLDRMGVVKRDGSRGIEGDEREACGFYSAFCFEKRGAK